MGRGVLPWVEAWARFELGDVPDEMPDDAAAAFPQQAGEVKALRLLALGDPASCDEAGEVLDELAGMEQDVPVSVRVAWLAGEARRRSGDHGLAREKLQAAELGAERYGIVPLLVRIRRSLRLLGETRSAPRGRAGALTTREREVLALVGSGHTNAEIARRVAVSVSTVRRLIDAASMKLGATSRSQAATLADQLPS